MQNIALNIVLNGVPQAISNLTQFEEVLIAARSQLSQLEIGSVAFKKLSGEIKTADNSLRQLKKQTEGKDLEGRLGDFGKLGGAIGSSFAAATAAIQLFGDGSEDSLKAVTAAQNALTIAFAARGVAEGVVVVENIALEISNYALAKSQLYVNTVTKAFYTTLAANPYTAILVGVGLLITAFIGLTSATDDAKKSQKEFNDALIKDIAKEQSSFESLQRTIENTNLGYETRKDALDKLREQFPKYFENLDDEEILNGKVKISYDKLAEAIRKAAQARALEGRITSRAEKLLDLTDREKVLQQQITKELKNQKDAQGVIITGGGVLGGQGINRTSNEQRLFGLQNQQKSVQKEINNLKALDLKDSKAISDIQEQTEKYTGGIKDDEKEITKEKEKQVITNTKLLAQEKENSGLLEDIKATLSFESVSEPTIIKVQEKVISNFESLLEKVKSVRPEIVSELEKILNPEQSTFDDPFRDIVNSTDQFLKLLTKVPVTYKDVEDVFNQLGKVGDLKVFTPDQRKDLILYFNTLKKTADSIIPAFENINKGQLLTQREVNELFELQIKKRKEISDKINKGELNNEEAKLELERNFLELLGKRLNINEKILKGLETSNEEQTETFNKELERLGYLKETRDVILTGVEALVKFSFEVEKQGEIISNNNLKIEKQIESLKKLITTLNPEELSKLLQSIGFDFNSAMEFATSNARNLLNNLGEEGLKKFISGINMIPVEFEKMTLKQVKAFKKSVEESLSVLKSLGIDVEGLFDNLFGNVEKSVKEKVIGNILDVIQELQVIFNTMSQTTSAYYNAQFDVLEKRNKRITEGIVGDSVAANQKRLEAEKSYQAQRAKLEKQAAKASLRISLAQSTANTAEAITKAVAVYGPTPGSFVAAAAVAALSAVQTAIIAQQLANIDSYRSGGRLKRQGGGMVFGPSHENGGIRFQGGGMELEGNESVINRVSTVNYMGLLSQINQSGGGRPIGPGYDDSRIVEAIAKQRNTPIRAYVVESDITAKQETARRLEKLSQI
jgi:hypothetical protein